MLKNDQLVYIGLELVIACLAVAGNVLVCWAVCLNSNLQSITNFFVVSLAVADIAVGLLAIPFAIAVSTGFCASFYGCLFIACFVLVLTQNSIFSLLAIAVDRYIAIKNPLRYNSLVTGQRAKGIIILCWALSVGIGLTPMMGWNTGWSNSATSSNSCPEGMTECLFEGVVTLEYMIYFNFFGCVLVPLVVMLVIYVHIFMAARRQLRLMGIKVAQAPMPGETTLSSSSSPSTLQKEVHAAKSLAIIVGLFAFCWLPLHIINCFNHLCQECNRPHIWVMNIAIILSHANSVVNPLIYAYRIREFRLTFHRILYQQILRQRDVSRFGARNRDSRGVGSSRSSVIGTSSSSRTSKEGLSCGTIVNSYILDPGSNQTSMQEMQEPSCLWTITLDPDTNSYKNSTHKMKGINLTAAAAVSAASQPCLPGFSVQEETESVQNIEGSTDAVELGDSRSCTTFTNTRAFFPKQTDRGCSAELTEVS